MVLSPHKNLGVIIGGTRNTSHVMITLTLICLDCCFIVSDNMNEDSYLSVMLYAH